MKLPENVYVYSKRHQIINPLFLMGYSYRTDTNTYMCNCGGKSEVFINEVNNEIIAAHCVFCGKDPWEIPAKESVVKNTEPKFGLLLFLTWLLFALIALLLSFLTGMYIAL